MYSILALNIGSEGDKIKKKTVSASASPVFFSQNFVTLVADFGPKLKTWSHQIMFYTNNFFPCEFAENKMADPTWRKT